MINSLKEHTTYHPQAKNKQNYFARTVEKLQTVQVLRQEGRQKLFYLILELRNMGHPVHIPPIVEEIASQVHWNHKKGCNFFNALFEFLKKTLFFMSWQVFELVIFVFKIIWVWLKMHNFVGDNNQIITQTPKELQLLSFWFIWIFTPYFPFSLKIPN